MQHKITEVENAGKENVAQDCRGGKCRKGKCGTKLQGWKMRERKMREKDLSIEIRKFYLSQTWHWCDTIQASVVSEGRHLEIFCAQFQSTAKCQNYLTLKPKHLPQPHFKLHISQLGDNDWWYDYINVCSKADRCQLILPQRTRN